MTHQADKAITGGLVVADGRISPATVLITGDRISAVTDPSAPFRTGQIIDAKGKYVLPGIIDAHLHSVYLDRIDTLSRAAASEGITTLIPYVGSVKAWGVDKKLDQAMKDFIQEGNETSLIDFSLHCTLLAGDVEDCDQSIPAMIEMGIVSFKVFMAYRKRGMMVEDEQLLKIMSVIADHGGLLAAHAENGALIDYMERYFSSRNQQHPKYYGASHPELSEAEAVFRFLSLARTAGCDTYLPHLSTAKALDVVRLFRKWNGQKFYTETCPHYLLLNERVFTEMGSIAKMSPPLRQREDQESLWQAVAEGLIDVVASDHAASHSTQKMPQWDKVFSAPNGVPGMECLVPLMLKKGVMEGRTTLIRTVEQLCEKPAKIFGLYPRKGVIAKGADADIAIFDLAGSRELAATHPELKIDYSLYEKMTVTAPPDLVLLRGRTVATKGVPVIDGEAGPQGMFIAGKTAKTP
ncbi:amidohydrolase family protein [Desulforhopalus singaporensis]|uniref:Dihydropyrimidinase n=1 Tax=Desulforhopalus singaporensis TaxID=91360 RepID=A0A1H0SK67_9BACT|nr:amidohydrolase family protein [Desulforhopalus singaporensis]SDP42107.1 dihydropyrimidinase [Desulforhopalus singaporensis]